MIDWGTAGQWGGDVLALIALFVALFNRRSDAITGLHEQLHESGKNLQERLDRHDGRLMRLENEVAHLPSSDLTKRIEIGLTELNGRLNTLSATLAPVAKISDRLQEFLLEQATRK